MALLSLLLLPLASAAGASGGESGSPSLFREDFEQAFFLPSPDHYLKDHGLLVGPDGLYHIFYIVGNADEAWQIPGNEIDFGHATSPDLVHWTVHDRVVSTGTSGWKSRNVWAPHVVPPREPGASYYMAYTGVDSMVNQAIGAATSDDLFAWTDRTVESPAYAPDTSWAAWSRTSRWSACRDPFLWWLDEPDRLGMVTSAQTRDGYLGQPPRGAVSYAWSTDGLNWTDAGVPLVINDDSSIMESPHLARDPLSGSWYLFYTRTSDARGVYHLRSEDVTDGWSLSTRTLFKRGFASEIFSSAGGASIFSSFHGFETRDGRLTRGVTFDSLRWTPEGPTLDERTTFERRWEQVNGDLGDLPTFHGGEKRNGFFWIHTADAYSGPFGSEDACATCGLDETRVGVLRSRPFVVRGSAMDLWVGGTATELAYVALTGASGEILLREHGTGTERLSLRTWDLCPFVGLEVRLEIVDHDPEGHVIVDAIEEREETGACPPSLDLAARVRPNPSAGRVAVEMRWDTGGAAEAEVFTAAGRLVRRLSAVEASGGRLMFEWDGRDGGDRPVPAGVYFLSVQDEDERGHGAGPIRIVRVPG